MRTLLTAATLVAAWGFGTQTVVAQSKKIDLQTKEGVAAVKGEWRYHDVKIVEVEGKGPDGKPNKTYNIEPRADGPDFDDSKWEVVAPETLQRPAFDRPGLLLLVSDQDHDPARSRRQGGLLPDDRRRLRRDLGRRQAAPDAGQRGRGRRRRLQRPQSRRAQGPPAGQGLSDRGLRHQRADLGGSVQLALPQEHGPRDRGQSVQVSRRGYCRAAGIHDTARNQPGLRIDPQAAGQGARRLRPGRPAAPGRDRSHQRVRLGDAQRHSRQGTRLDRPERVIGSSA